MKKMYFIMIAIMLVLTLVVGCTEPQNTDPSMSNLEGNTDIFLLSFDDYNEYSEYIVTAHLPEYFVHAKEFTDLGAFDSAMLWYYFNLNIEYTYVDENNNEIVLTFEVLPEASPTDITKYLIEEYEENNTQNQRFVEYSADFFVNNNLLQCYNDGIRVTDICIGDMNYHYLGGNLYSIQFIRNGLLCTISWQNNNTNAQAWYDGSFLLERNNAVSKLIFASTATAGFNEICGKITTAVVE